MALNKTPKKIVILGAGFGGMYVLKELHELFHNDSMVHISLVNERNYFLFTPLLHEVATGSVNPENIIEPIRKVLGCCVHNLCLGKAEYIKLNNRVIKVGEQTIAYDYLVLAPGAQTNFYGIPGAEEYSFTLKSLEDAIKIKNRCIAQMERTSHISNRAIRKRMLRFVVVGGGPTGVELAAELQEFIRETFSSYYSCEIIEDVSVVLIQKNQELLPQFGQKLRKKSLDVLRKKGVEVLLETGVFTIESSRVVLDSGESLETETVIWVAGVKPTNLKFDIPVSSAPDDRLIVNEFLQLEHHLNIFAIGDIAAIKPKGTSSFLPPLAQVAVAEGVVAAQNIKNLIEGRPLKTFLFKHKGNLVSLGAWMAIGEISRYTFSGHITWWLWRTVYLSKLISNRKKIKVAFDWTINIFSPRDISQL